MDPIKHTSDPRLAAARAQIETLAYRKEITQAQARLLLDDAQHAFEVRQAARVAKSQS